VADFCAFSHERFNGRLADALAELGPEDASPVKREAFLRHAAHLGFLGDAGRVFDALDVGGRGVLLLGELRSQLSCAAGAALPDRPSVRKRSPSPGRGPSPGRKAQAAGAKPPRSRRAFSSPEVATGKRRDSVADALESTRSSLHELEGNATVAASMEIVKGGAPVAAEQGKASCSKTRLPTESVESAAGVAAEQKSAQGGQSATTGNVCATEQEGAGAGAEAGGGPAPPRAASPKAPSPKAQAAVTHPPAELPPRAAASLSQRQRRLLENPPTGAGEGEASPDTDAHASSSIPRRSSLASLATLSSAVEALLPSMGPPRTTGTRLEPMLVTAPMAGPEDDDGIPMIDTSDFVMLRPLPYVPVLPDEEDGTRPRTFVHHGRLITVPLLPLHRLGTGHEEVKPHRGSNWGLVKSKVIGGPGGAVNE